MFEAIYLFVTIGCEWFCVLCVNGSELMWEQTAPKWQSTFDMRVQWLTETKPNSQCRQFIIIWCNLLPGLPCIPPFALTLCDLKMIFSFIASFNWSSTMNSLPVCVGRINFITRKLLTANHIENVNGVSESSKTFHESFRLTHRRLINKMNEKFLPQFYSSNW